MIETIIVLLWALICIDLGVMAIFMYIDGYDPLPIAIVCAMYLVSFICLAILVLTDILYPSTIR